MTAITTNQLKTYCFNNLYIQSYINGIDSYYYWNKINKTPSVFTRYNDKDYSTDIITYRTNELSYYATESINKRFNINLRSYKVYYCTFEGIKLRYNVNIRLDGNVSLIITSANIEDNYFNKIPFTDQYNLKFEYKGILNEVNYSKFITFELNKYLFAPGLFRDIQLYNYSTKKDAKQLYKRYMLQHRNLLNYDITEVTKWIKRKFNIDISEAMDDIKAINYCKRNGKHSKLVKLIEFPNMEYLTDYEDTDDIEKEFYEVLNTYEGYIFY